MVYRKRSNNPGRKKPRHNWDGVEVRSAVSADDLAMVLVEFLVEISDLNNIDGGEADEEAG